jgi:hypothetical protein
VSSGLWYRTLVYLGLKAGIANAYPHLRHLVFSTTLDAAPDPAVELVRHNPAVRETVRAIHRRAPVTMGGRESQVMAFAERCRAIE